MATNQALIQTRSVDALQQITSYGVNSKLKAIINGTQGLIDGYDIVKLTDITLRVTPGRCVKDFVTIKYIDNVALDITGLSDGNYYVVLEYEYVVQIPLNTAAIKIITPAEYAANTSKYLFFGMVVILGGLIDQILYRDAGASIGREFCIGHNSLSTIQGGSIDYKEYYHLSQAEYNAISSMVVPTGFDHNESGNKQGGDALLDYFYHLTSAERDGLSALVSNDQARWHTNPLYISGGRIDANKLGTRSSGDLASDIHTHDHITLTNLEGEANYYHVTSTELTTFRDIVTGVVKLPNADKLDGKHGSEYALDTHDHQHYNMLGMQGGTTFEYYHFSQAELQTLLDIYSGVIPAPNTNKLDGLDSLAFAFSTHNHAHNSLTGYQGGTATEQYHASLSQRDTFQGILAGTSKAPNTDRLDGLHWDSFSQATHTHNHNSLSGKQGGSTSQYYHLTKNQYDGVVAANAPSATNVLLTQSAFVPGMLTHNTLFTIQGGTTSERYHISSSQFSMLTAAQDASSLHHHNSSLYTKAQSDSISVNRASDTMTGILNLNNHLITSVGAPSGTSDLASKTYVDIHLAGSISHYALSNLQGGQSGQYYHITNTELTTLISGGDASTMHHHDTRYYSKSVMDTAEVPFTGGTMTGVLTMSTTRVTGMAAPVDSGDLATKTYVDGITLLPYAVIRHGLWQAPAMTGAGYTLLTASNTFSRPVTVGGGDLAWSTIVTTVINPAAQVLVGIWCCKEPYLSNSTTNLITLVYTLGGTPYTEIYKYNLLIASRIAYLPGVRAASEIIAHLGKYYCLFASGGNLVLKDAPFASGPWTDIGIVGTGDYGRLSLKTSPWPELGFLTNTSVVGTYYVGGSIVSASLPGYDPEFSKVLPATTADGSGAAGFFVFDGHNKNHGYFVRNTTGTGVRTRSTQIPWSAGDFLPTYSTTSATYNHVLMFPKTTALTSTHQVPVSLLGDPNYGGTASGFQMKLPAGLSAYGADITETATVGRFFTGSVVGSVGSQYVTIQVSPFTQVTANSVSRISATTTVDALAEGGKLHLAQPFFAYRKNP